MNNNIQFIYFDVGGVAIFDFSKTNKWNEMLDDLGIAGGIRKQFDQLFDEHEEKICMGEDINIFMEEARSKLGIEFPIDYDMIEDFVDRFESNQSLLELLEKLKGNFGLGLLTAQYARMLDMILQKGLLPSDIWDVVIDSSVEKITKPDPKIYSLAEEKAAIPAQNILFVDNKAELLEIPKQRGWQTFEYDPASPEESTEKLKKIIF
jgi:FMN phosphatase YigB (HAD superfamily)